jgi:hypothetical protein
MPTLNFQKRFAEDVRTGKKRQTIRAYRKKNIKPGDILYFYTGQRTAVCQSLGKGVCLKTRHITVDCAARSVWLATSDGWGYSMKGLGRKAVLALAKADGFTNRKEFFEFFEEHHGRVMNGQLITW